MIPANYTDYRELARKRLPHFLFEYIDGGAFSETTLRHNEQDLQSIGVRQRVLRDISNVSTNTHLFGQDFALPIILAPVGIAGLNARRGEVQAAQAAEHKGIPFCLSTVSACAIDEVRSGVNQPIWFQLYMMRDRGFLREMLARAREAGSRTLLFTVDMPVPATRYRDIRSGLSGGSLIRRKLTRVTQVMRRPGWAWDVGLFGRPHTLGNIAPVLGDKAGIDEFWSWLGNNFDPTVTWKDIDRIREEWSGELIIKGILDPDDARQAAALGADGLIVSNHGGRQLDGASSSIRALPAIADAVGDDITVLMDSGIRSGLDVVRALALGAKAVMIGRPWVYALAARQRAGVEDLLDRFASEMRVVMALSGCNSLSDITPDILDLSPSDIKAQLRELQQK
ncbi:FMN-dependent L-lactate dehydrogenase LldD [Cellvibrio polysaccharolyticus]|uniref:Alpha-hydroxy-acid oxidizing protein n=1 Tax=Cellvibrio polysaccharolyticus TaxID=2082724 RepID=A0A928V3H8_9GAMM|nr:FMN-dependent L-lactate dehydrogenase LldD [Cellvibrio polysaccharolyticus]MBE8718096.1 alpha-hydroxy-acid oxidizing protein [Cellvibrio polysaccharolyticus]